ncbi:hypothetical protein NCLIV_013370 [Neospora caninum Liverpool]|uniref:Zinc finger (CCCH type) motif-containing protein n=1 Tax=Neospora caninum (strain Liverpool) TaxID=572307 RepID=F0VD29_NEOCL|nr:hypothetical protein NCLIV_013370 [Neospora caninum Liverpool]CBZ51544.1 hypothetical protein NCLIV_013370 [Neospora caninum Liverpool]CEL65494.1 TPA: zinc finger (CCCH type) motif-containing protein [Neospora caninum Liverpool]|eukprot:XP_003881577.1 hypothetical protein NCLIV_013370 [Neospora caninum Liverpool]
MRPRGSGCLSAAPAAPSSPGGTFPADSASIQRKSFSRSLSSARQGSLSATADQLRAQVAALAKALHEDRRRRASSGQPSRVSRPSPSLPVFYNVPRSSRTLTVFPSSSSSPGYHPVGRDTSRPSGPSPSTAAAAAAGVSVPSKRQVPPPRPDASPTPSASLASASLAPAAGGRSGGLAPKAEHLSAGPSGSDRLRILKEQVAHMQMLVAKKKEQERRAEERWETRKRQRALWRQNIHWNRLVNTPAAEETPGGDGRSQISRQELFDGATFPAFSASDGTPFASWAAAKAGTVRKEAAHPSVGEGGIPGGVSCSCFRVAADSFSSLPMRSTPWTTSEESVRPSLESGKSAAPKFRNRSLTFCKFYNGFGYCRNGDSCPFYHDRSRETQLTERCEHVNEEPVVCRLYLKGLCESADCSLAHEAPVTPVCARFLQGLCIRDECMYRHEFGAQTPVALVEGNAVVDSVDDAGVDSTVSEQLRLSERGEARESDKVEK